MILWRPVGFHEMAKVFEAGMKGFPPRLPEQSIFYPVLVQEYADQTAATWNTKEEPFVGYVIEMEILDEYGARFTPQTVGSAIHRELWVPSEELAEFNNQHTKPVSVRRAYFGPKYRGHVPDKFGLRGADAYKQIAMMVGTMDYSMFDFAMEVSANMLTFFEPLCRRPVIQGSDVKWRQGRVMTMKLTAVFEKVPEGYIAFVEELPGANTQGATMEEARSNLHEAVEMVLDANRVLAEEALNGRNVIREPFVIVSQ